MKKKFLECSVHGETLFRCKRVCWKIRSKKDKGYADEYTEKCFKCMSEGRYLKKVKPVVERRKHVKI